MTRYTGEWSVFRSLSGYPAACGRGPPVEPYFRSAADFKVLYSDTFWRVIVIS